MKSHVVGRIIGIRHRHSASAVFGPERPVQVYIREPVKEAMDRTQSFQLMDDEAVEQFVKRVIRKGDTFLLSGDPRANRLAYQVAHRAHEVGAETYRIASKDLRSFLNNVGEDMSQVITWVWMFMPREFSRVTEREVRAYRTRHGLDQCELEV